METVDLEKLLASIFSGDADFDESAVRLAEHVVELYREMGWYIEGYAENV